MQEIYDAEATGIVRQVDDGYLAEVARGHFVPKGVVDPSRFTIAESGEVLGAHRVAQNTVYHFINGYVVTESPAEHQLELTDEEIGAAVMQVVPLFKDYPSSALEFGVLRTVEGITGYVIDVAESDAPDRGFALTTELLASGVVSPGRARGDVKRIRNAKESDLDAHLLSVLAGNGEALTDSIFFADRASVDLLPVLARCGSNCAFVFHRASVLAHLCVVLRERGIPAILIEDDQVWRELPGEASVAVDASTPHIDPALRLGW